MLKRRLPPPTERLTDNLVNIRRATCAAQSLHVLPMPDDREGHMKGWHGGSVLACHF